MSEEKQEKKENHIDVEEKEATTVEDEKPKENGDNHSDSESSDEELGTLEGPVQILNSKRERKSTSRLSLDTTDAKKDGVVEEVLDYTQGKGAKLGDIPYVTWSIDGDSIDDLKPMHKLLYFTKKEPKRNALRNEIKEFQGYPFAKDTKYFKSRHGLMYRFTIPGLRYIITSLGMEWKKSVEGEDKPVNIEREELINMLVDFLYEPKDNQKRIPQSVTPAAKKKTPAKKTPAKKPSSAKKPTPKTKAPKTKKSEGDTAEEESTDETASPSKKKKVDAKKKPTQVKIKSAKKSPTAKKVERKRKANDGSSEDDEPLVKKSKTKEPTNDEVRKAIKGILKDADLEQVTMKTVCKQVYEMYPDFDMTGKKDFIKSTVKEIIS